MRDTLTNALRLRFQSYADLVDQLDDAAIDERIDAPKHKSLKEHLWCVVGARESYAKAIRAGRWSGFACSMTAFSRDDLAGKLESSSAEVLAAIDGVDDWTPEREGLLLTLAEHEVMHEGQIIRHMYGMGRTLPASWKWA
jgi:hypothetical protein